MPATDPASPRNRCNPVAGVARSYNVAALNIWRCPHAFDT